MNKSLFTTRELAPTGLMATVTCILSPTALPVSFSPVLVTFENLALFLTVYVLGMKNDFISYVIYFLIGIASFPIFPDFLEGMGKVASPTDGYLTGFFFMVLTVGYLTDRYHAKKGPSIAGMVLGALACNLVGTVWLSHQLGISLLTGLSSGVIPYLSGDLVKIVMTSFLGSELRKAISRL